MTELRALLDPIAGDPAPPTPDVVTHDVSRGRAALRRRRGFRAAAGVCLAAAVAVCVVAVPNLGGTGTETRVSTPAADDPPNPGVDLVGYEGPLSGSKYRPAEVPSGWTVDGSASVLLIAPPGMKPDPEGLVVLKDKIAVYIEAKGWGLGKENGKPAGGMGPAIAVGDRTGYLITADPAAMQLEVPIGDGRALRVQVPHTLKWDNATMARFLAGVTVLDGATATAG